MPECGLEWSSAASIAPTETVRDSVRNVLQDGNTVTVIKDLKLKGSSLVIRFGTRVRNIRLVDGDHDIDCKIAGVAQIGLKYQFVKRVADQAADQAGSFCPDYLPGFRRAAHRPGREIANNVRPSGSEKKKPI